MNDWLDTEGRPLGEAASASYVGREAPCPYAGRHGRPMNLDALRQVAAVWPDVLATLRARVGRRPTVHRAWWACGGMVDAPAAWRRVHDRPLPAPIAAAYKAAIGYHQVLTFLLLTGDDVADTPLSDVGDPDALLAFVTDHGWLVGDRQACAGSPAWIRDGFAALSGVGAEDPVADASCDEAAVRIGLDAVRALAGARIEAPWARALLAVPHADVRRLYPRGAVPPEVEAALR